MKPFSLSDGTTGELRSRKEVSVRLARLVYAADEVAAPVQKKMKSLTVEGDAVASMTAFNTGLTDSEKQIMQDLTAFIMVAMVARWSKGEVNYDAMIDLPEDVFTELSETCVDEWNGGTDFRSEKDGAVANPTPPSVNSLDLEAGSTS